MSVVRVLLCAWAANLALLAAGQQPCPVTQAIPREYWGSGTLSASDLPINQTLPLDLRGNYSVTANGIYVASNVEVLVSLCAVRTVASSVPNTIGIQIGSASYPLPRFCILMGVTGDGTGARSASFNISLNPLGSCPGGAYPSQYTVANYGPLVPDYAALSCPPAPAPLPRSMASGADTTFNTGLVPLPIPLPPIDVEGYLTVGPNAVSESIFGAMAIATLCVRNATLAPAGVTRAAGAAEAWVVEFGDSGMAVGNRTASACAWMARAGRDLIATATSLGGACPTNWTRNITVRNFYGGDANGAARLGLGLGDSAPVQLLISLGALLLTFVLAGHDGA